MINPGLFDADGLANPNNNIFGLPFSEMQAKLILLPVPWEVTVSYGAGTARAPGQIFDASMQVDLFDPDTPDAWKQGIFMLPPDNEVLTKSDELRKLAEDHIELISTGKKVDENPGFQETLNKINAGSKWLNNWVYEQSIGLLKKGKLVGLVGGDHSTPLGSWKAHAEVHGEFSLLHIDAHCDLRKAYEDFIYSHASILYNGLKEISQITNLVQVGLRDYSRGEWETIQAADGRIAAYTDRSIKTRMLEGETWKSICDEIIGHLYGKVYISYDIDGLDPKLCPNTGTPVPGGLEAAQVHYLLKRLRESGRKIIGFDLVEVGLSDNEWDANVGARELWKLCNELIAANNE